jgi:hypothetical protein
MQTFDAWALAMLLHHLDDHKRLVFQMCETGNGDKQLDAQAMELFIIPTILMAQIQSKKAHLQSTHDRVWDGGGPFWMDSKIGMTYQEAKNQLTVLQQCIEADLEKRLFAFIEPRHASLFNEMEETWKDIFSCMPDSKIDVEDAHIARMVELDTATVFHMMRVAEYGLRRMAVKLRVRLTHKGKAMPIEFADWEKVITGMKNKIDAIRKTKVGPTRVKQLEKCSDAADHCTFMKDIWRNNVSHARKPYKASEALAVLERVRDFMRFVAREFT